MKTTELDESLWVGGDHKITTQGGKMKFRKRNRSSIPADIKGGQKTGPTANVAMAEKGDSEWRNMTLAKDEDKNWEQFSSSGPKTKEEIDEYKSLLSQGLVQPTEMELFICDADGRNLKQLTDLGNANWSPFFHPSGKKILFSSNFEVESGFPFNLYMIDIDGRNLTRITHGETFDAFPVFSNDGKKLVFSSNRNNGDTRDTNLFIAEWID